VKEKFILNSLALIESKREVTDLERKKLKYGLEGFYNLATKLIVMVILAILLDILFEFLLLTFVYSILRLYGFGIHAKKTWQCWITTVPIYIGGCFLIKYFAFPVWLNYFIWFIGLISFLLFAPADTPSRPLIYKRKRIKAKVLSLIILGFCFLAYVFIKDSIVQNIITYAVLVEAISINPLIYKIFRTPFNNYKAYEKKMV